MANLANCTVTTYTATEYEGDSFLNDNIGLQTYNNSPLPETQYILIISSNPGYEVQASYITINEIEPDVDGSIRIWFLTNSAIEAIENVTNVWMRDVGTPGEPDNTVEVKVFMDNTFVMPSSDYTINIDLDGDALPYEPTVTPDIGTVNPSAFGLTTSFMMANIDTTIFQKNQQNQVNQIYGPANSPDMQILVCNGDNTDGEADVGYFATSPQAQNIQSAFTTSIYEPTTSEVVNLSPSLCHHNFYNVDNTNDLITTPSFGGVDLPSGITYNIQSSWGLIQALNTFINVYYSLTYYWDENGDLVTIPYTSSNNLSAVNLGGVTYTQVDCLNVNVYVPFNSSFMFPSITTNSSGQALSASSVYIKTLYTCYGGMMPEDVPNAECWDNDDDISTPGFGPG